MGSISGGKAGRTRRVSFCVLATGVALLQGAAHRLARAETAAAAAEIAEEADDERGSLPVIETHGFVSQGGIKTTKNTYLASHSRGGTVEFTEVGINFTAKPAEKLRMGLQLFSNKLGETGNFSLKADWFYVDYRWRDWLGIRAGRVKLPLGLYNDTADIDAARVPILLPQSVYPLSNRDYLLAQTGLELYGFLDLRAVGTLEYRIYGGTIFIPLTSQSGPVQLTSLDTRHVVGGRLLWDTPVPGLRLGGSLQELQVDFQLQAAATAMMAATTATAKVPVVIWVASAEYAAHDLLAAAEYSRWWARVKETSDPALFPITSSTSERLYAMASYHLNRFFFPGVYYSLLRPDLYNDPTMTAYHGPAASQHDVAATLRFDINSHWLLKVEGHLMHGTAGLSSSLNNNVPAASLRDNWGVFLVKTTAYF